MFDRPQHRLVQAVPQGFRAEVLAEGGFLFGGGTRIVLDLEEYRISKDIDFVCSKPDGYAELRFAATRRSFDALFTEEGRARLRFPREIRVDQYGIRFPVGNGEDLLGVELIREARIELDPGERPAWSPVDSDCCAEKLLASALPGGRMSRGQG